MPTPMRNISYAANRQDIRISAETPSLFSPVIEVLKGFTAMQNANHGARRSSSTDIKGGRNTSRRDEIMEIHSQALECPRYSRR
ncbi:uncharacterized protein BDCG_06865 [Blastomyces dermatitidis ER-3]|uniref:Uncharacterized protein n=2 Tax=Ajellomyces dermatitidis TaxID=5039 RepID=F2TSD8_AJEDA|nr:uncharacterized protein BDCG_06865 [Blastomyces dermatitidis ER-3]EEQ91745.2 hypothetical protein BDCG_06865 [Blastomyces dermatitidis ER-3]EGE86151.1 hypothetical protein BDDG_09096 [Blastomyces dermatitidis ATCC 18188]